MDITTARDEQGMPILSLTGELDLYTQEALAKELNSWVEDSLERRVGLDLSGVDFLDSAGIRLIQDTSFKMKRKGRKLVLHGTSPQAQKAMALLTAAGLINL